MFALNAVTVISDGISAAMSSFSGGFEHYAVEDDRRSRGRLGCTRAGSAHQGCLRAVTLPRHRQELHVFSQESVTDRDSGQKTTVLIKRVASTTSLGGQLGRRVDRQAAGRTVTGAVASSGTPRGPASRSRCCSTPPRSCAMSG